MGRLPQISLSSFFILFDIHRSLPLIQAENNLTPPSATPINRDLYHDSDALMEVIQALVNRHQDKLSMDTFKSKNRGYEAVLAVVTYCRNRKEIDGRVSDIMGGSSLHLSLHYGSSPF